MSASVSRVDDQSSMSCFLKSASSFRERERQRMGPNKAVTILNDIPKPTAQQIRYSRCHFPRGARSRTCVMHVDHHSRERETEETLRTFQHQGQSREPASAGADLSIQDICSAVTTNTRKHDPTGEIAIIRRASVLSRSTDFVAAVREFPRPEAESAAVRAT